MAAEFRIEQWQEYAGDDWWNWAVWVEGSERDLDRIEYVEWTLHPTFPDPIRKVTNRAQKFRLDTGGWGVFKIRARLQLTDGGTVRLSHNLALHHEDGTPTNA